MLCIVSESCKHITHVKFHRCLYLEDEALENMSYLKDSLQDLQIISCGNITDKGVKSLQTLRLVFVCGTMLTSLPSFCIHSSLCNLAVWMKYLISGLYPRFHFVLEEQVCRKENLTLTLWYSHIHYIFNVFNTNLFIWIIIFVHIIYPFKYGGDITFCHII